MSPIPGNFGQGFPGLLYLSTLSYLSVGERPAALRKPAQQMFYSELLHAHEAAHQWWGNIVTSASYQDDWIMRVAGKLFRTPVSGEKERSQAARRNPCGIQVAPVAEGTRRPHVGIRRSYHLGTAPQFFAGAQRVAGDHLREGLVDHAHAAWPAGRRAVLEDALGNGQPLPLQSESTEQFRSLAAEFVPPKSADPKLENFFEQWVYGTGVPALKIEYATSGRPPAVKLRGTVTQTAVDEDFSAYVPVEVQLPGKQVTTRWVQTSSEPVSFYIELKQLPSRVTLDPSGSILAIRK